MKLIALLFLISVSISNAEPADESLVDKIKIQIKGQHHLGQERNIYFPNIDRLKNELLKFPLIPLELALQKTINWNNHQ